MSDETPFFPEPRVAQDLRVDAPTDAMIRQEVFYESDLNTIKRRPLFLGFAFSRRRFITAGVFAFVCFSFLIGRAAWMQIHEQPMYQSMAEANRLRSAPVWPRRGIVRDRTGQILADNVSRFQVTLTPRDLPDPSDGLDLEIGEVARLLGLSVADLAPAVNASGTARDESVLIADRIPYEQAMAIAVAMPHLPGFRLDVRPERRYPMSTEIPSLSHILGYVGKISDDEYQTRKDAGYEHADEIGKTGIERSYETRLRGTIGEQTTEVDAHGRIKGFAGEKPAVDGEDIQLTIDANLQRAAEQALRDGMKAAKVDRGAVVVLNPQNGEILASVSLPAYDDNAFSGGVSSTVYQAIMEDENQPLFARAWSGAYPSGSTVKIVISVGALMEHVIEPATTILSTGGLRVGSWFFPDWKAGGHGLVNVRSALAWSVNTFFYTVGGGYESFVGLGAERLSSWLKRFGLGSKTGLDVPSESAGFVPTPAWREQRNQHWYVGDTYNLSIGQGDLLVTPMQVATYTAEIANGGLRVTPHFVNSPQNTTTTERIADADMVQVVRQGMRDGVTYGSSRALAGLPFTVAGKTGTAQWRADKPTHAWHTCFAPYENPEIVVTVLLEEGGEGSTTAIPVSKKILEAWWAEKNR